MTASFFRRTPWLALLGLLLLSGCATDYVARTQALTDLQEALARGQVVLAPFRDEQRDGLLHASGRVQLVDRRTGAVIVEVMI